MIERNMMQMYPQDRWRYYCQSVSKASKMRKPWMLHPWQPQPLLKQVQIRSMGSVRSCTASLSEKSASDLRLHLIKASTKQHVSSLVFPSGTSTTNDSITIVPGLPSIISGWREMIEEQFWTKMKEFKIKKRKRIRQT